MALRGQFRASTSSGASTPCCDMLCPIFGLLYKLWAFTTVVSYIQLALQALGLHTGCVLYSVCFTSSGPPTSCVLYLACFISSGPSHQLCAIFGLLYKLWGLHTSCVLYSACFTSSGASTPCCDKMCQLRSLLLKMIWILVVFLCKISSENIYLVS